MKKFDTIIAGIGGHGVLTLAEVVMQAGFNEGLNVKGAELHGLAVRFGSIRCHVRFGKRIYSPTVMDGNADLIIATEPLEALRAYRYASRKTSFLLNDKPVVPLHSHLTHTPYPSVNSIVRMLKSISRCVVIVPAHERVKELIGKPIAANLYLLGRACAEGMLPIKKQSVVAAMKKLFSEKTFKQNLTVFEAGFTER